MKPLNLKLYLTFYVDYDNFDFGYNLIDIHNKCVNQVTKVVIL